MSHTPEEILHPSFRILVSGSGDLTIHGVEIIPTEFGKRVAAAQAKLDATADGEWVEIEGDLIPFMQHKPSLRDELLAMLKELEWSGQGHCKGTGSYNYCTFCYANDQQGHFENCEYAALIAKAEGK